MIASIQALDTAIVHAVQSIGPAWYDTALLLSFVIGSTKWLAPAIVLVLLFIGKKRTAVELFFIYAFSVVCLMVFKHLIHADRPYWTDPSIIGYVSETDYGMPSGHAFLSIIILGWVWFRHPKSKTLSIGAGVLIFLIGLSRVYLGVHYPTQVLVGWGLGLLFLWMFYWIDKKYFRPRSGYVEKSK